MNNKHVTIQKLDLTLTSWEQLRLPENCAVSEHQLDNVCQLVFFLVRLLSASKK